MPTSFGKKLIILYIPLNISFNFWNPKVPVSFNFSLLFSPIITMPKFAIDKYCQFMLCVYNVWTTRKFL